MGRIKFKVNGKEYSVGKEVSSDQSMLDYIRDTLQLRGTKYMCREGGCGTCIVTASKSAGAPSVAINSCLVNITQCQGWEITTIEDLGNRKKGYHVIQETLRDNHGTQCGYCTPGWVMAMHGLRNQFKDLKMIDIEKGFGSNLCRCTGYRPILQAFKKFAKDAPKDQKIVDIEELYICKKTGKNCNKGSCDEDDWCMVNDEDLNDDKVVKISLKDGKTWYRPTKLADVFNILKSDGADNYMLVGGNTAKGVIPIDEYPNLLIDISAIPELKANQVDQNLIVGGAVTLTDFLEILKNTAKRDYFSYLQKLYDHIELVAHIPVRNVGTIAGNLMIKHKANEFQSDIFLLLTTINAQLTIKDWNNQTRIVTMLDFLKLDMKGKVIVNVMLPPYNDLDVKVVTYKIMPRSQSAHAIVNAGFIFKMNNSNNTVQQCRIVYGALSPNFNRAFATEAFLVGKPLFNNATLQGALKVLDGEMIIVENPPEPSAKFRRLLAKSLFYKALLSLSPTFAKAARNQSGSTKIHEERGVSEGSQTFTTNPSLWPLNQPVVKLEGTIQCAGEAKYTEDIPSIRDEVFAALVLSTVANGTIVSIDPSLALKLPGVIAFYSAKDIPGLNSFTPSEALLYSANEEVFAEGTVKFYNQPIGVVVAETRQLADRAAKLVRVRYNNTTRAVVDIKEARSDSNRNTLFMSKDATNKGTDVFRTITGTHTLYGQYHMPMETLVSVVYPTEEGLEVHSATQWLDGTHTMIARALNMDENKIDVYVRRLGGAYGLKISRSIQSAVACALVVSKLNRPCRIIQPLTTNMRAVGKRLPCVNDFTVSVNSTGVIQHLETTIYEDNGYKQNELLSLLGTDVYYNCYDESKFTYKVYDTITDTPKNTWCRAPGTLESITFIEMIMERISYELSLDPIAVRLANLDIAKFGEMMGMVDMLKAKADYNSRRAAVNSFNAQNRWKKRGIRFGFARWAPAGFLRLQVNLSVYHTDGTVVITHGGVEMGQGINTKAAQMAAYFLKIPLEKIQIKGNNTIITPNTYISGGSLTTQHVCVGLKRCCDQLLQRLEPVRSTMNNPEWLTLVKAAYDQNIDLQAHGYTGATDAQTYNIYGMACTEVEVDILTGEFEILRMDAIQDVGLSISPEIDVGQVEGAMVMGLGYFTCERLAYDQSGKLLTDRTWDYHLPEARDIPKDTRIYFKPNSYSNDIILGSKGTGEPAICMTPSIAFAIQEAIVSARQETGIPTTQAISYDGPFSNEFICLTANTNPDRFALN